MSKDNLPNVVGDGLRKDENWTYDGIYDYASYYFDKGDYCIVPITEQAIQDKNFLAILKKNNLHVKKVVCCLIRYGDGSTTEKDAIRIKKELEMDEKIFTVEPEIPK